MLIVSKYKDYYDVGSKYGIDKTVVYDRKLVIIKGGFPRLKHEVSERTGWHKSVLGFCGKFYPLVYYVENYVIERIVWNVEEAVKSIPRNRFSYRYRWEEDSLECEKGVRTFFDRKYPDLEKLFHEHRVPIFGFKPVDLRPFYRRDHDPYKTLVLNPNLKAIEFFRVVDPITAFQNVYMFLSGVIGSEVKPSKPIDDNVMAASKGHDGEYSFKKPPGGKRWI